eukprot:gnl/TRDRNA2_/TRDRNA2_197020_c0_seq1.p1 gnl/TRDRNA2_/TRDRNA2_197020_c0~~gnl/TRDRNA2_/TRDRNA2_197020_c0_seq1.p1  ORF type:complete len:206 (+),score=25.76 gnl/TRDRNA2_/TRDRNA2_197020_c0_seq1:71-619(+)
MAAPRQNRKPEDILLRSMFRLYDKNQDGSLSKQECEAMFAELGIDATVGENSELMFQVIDADGSEKIYYDEFVAWARHTPLNTAGQYGRQAAHADFHLAKCIASYPEQIQWMVENFHWYDVDHSGSLSREEFMEIANEYAWEPKPDWDSVLAETDVSETGTLDLNEFIRWMLDHYNELVPPA